MKRRISDMLSDYEEQELHVEEKTPLSSERIREMTMRKINHTEKTRRTGRGFFGKVLIAAALISMLTITAGAAEYVFGAGDFFRSILGSELQERRELAQKDGIDVAYPETVSEGQIAVVNRLGKVFEEQTFTDQGTTMTLTAAYADENMIQLYLKLEAPEGTVLPDGILYQFCDWNAIDYSDPDHYAMFTLGEDVPYDEDERYISYSSDCVKALPDADPGDNKKDFLITLTAYPEQQLKFNDGFSKYLHIMGIYQQIPDVKGDEDGYVLLAPGEFTFDFGIANTAEQKTLDVAGLTYGGHKTRTWTHNSECKDFCKEKLTGQTDPENGLPVHSESWDYQITAKSLTISPLSAEWECDFTFSDERMVGMLDFKVVLKDGTTVPKLGSNEWVSDTKSSGITYFAVPIDMEQVDYILIGDPEIGSTHKVYVK